MALRLDTILSSLRVGRTYKHMTNYLNIGLEINTGYKNTVKKKTCWRLKKVICHGFFLEVRAVIVVIA